MSTGLIYLSSNSVDIINNTSDITFTNVQNITNVNAVGLSSYDIIYNCKNINKYTKYQQQNKPVYP